MTDYSQRHRERVTEARVRLGGVCVSCNTDERLEFDHILPASKRYKVTRMTTASHATFWAEVAKCQLLCRPCHVIKSVNEGSMVDPGRAHGTRTAFRKRGCRCDECIAWDRARNRYDQTR